MNELETRLSALDVEWPDTPNIAAAVQLRLEPRRRRPFALRRPLAVALAGLLVLSGGALAASEDLRDAIGDLFGIGGVEIKRVPERPPPPPATGADLGLGRAVSLADARDRVSFDVLVPGQYDSVYYSSEPAGGRVSFVSEQPQLMLTEFRGDQIRTFIQKSIAPGTTARNVSVNGGPGVWLAGRPHQVIYRDADGEIREDAVRLAGNVLLWEQGGLTLRLEGAASLDDATAYAARIR